MFDGTSISLLCLYDSHDSFLSVLHCTLFLFLLTRYRHSSTFCSQGLILLLPYLLMNLFCWSCKCPQASAFFFFFFSNNCQISISSPDYHISNYLLGTLTFFSCILFPIFIYQFSSVSQLCLTLCNPMNCSTPGLPVHHQLLEFTQTHVHRVGDAIQPSHPLSSPSPPAPNPSQHQSLFQ